MSTPEDPREQRRPRCTSVDRTRDRVLADPGADAPGARIETGLRRLGIAVVAGAALLAVNSLYATSGRWVALGVAVQLLPTAMQLCRSLRVPGVWVAVFLVSQAVVSLGISVGEDARLPPNLLRTVELPDGSVPGISGRQVFTTDRMGFRVTREIAYDAKPPSALRILAIGGSTTEQALLDDRKTWTHLLQESMQQRMPERIVEVINAGSSGTRAMHHLAVLRASARIQPDVVLFMMGVNDWSKHIREHYGSSAYRPSQEFLWAVRLENTLLGGVIRRAFDALHNISGMPTTVGTELMSGATRSLDRQETRSLFLGVVASDYAIVVSQIIAECHQQRVQCVFLTQPHAYREGASQELRSRFWMTPPFEDYALDLGSLAAIADTYNSYLLTAANSQGVGSCDVAASMISVLDGFYDDCHFNELGARSVAAAVADCLTRDPAQHRFPMH